MEDSQNSTSPSEERHFPPLTAENLPELMEVTEEQALEYVSQLLQQLISIHQRHGCSIRRDRRPSFEDALETSDQAVQKLVPARNFAVSINGAEGEESNPPIEPTVELENAVELYKRFWLKEVPPISVPAYLQRFHRYCRSSAATYLTTGRLIYLVSVDRRIIPVTERNVYRLFCAAFMVAAKFIEDTMYPMSRYATTAGLKKSDLSRLEVTFLLLANFDVKVDRETLKAGLKAWAELNSVSQVKDDVSSAQPQTSPIPAV